MKIYNLAAIKKAIIILASFACGAAILLNFTYTNTAEKIAENQRAALVDKLNEVLAGVAYDNDLYAERFSITHKYALGSDKPQAVYLAKKSNKLVAMVFNFVVPDGYNGKIEMLIAIDDLDNILGLRVLSHRETPGLGDYIELRKSPWVLSFNGKNLLNPDAIGWHVKRDQGQFDQFTGATITPRAIVKSVYRLLQYVQLKKDEIIQLANQAHEQIN